MAESLKLEVVTPDSNVVSEEVKIVMSPGILGEFGVLPGHTPFLTELKLGTIRYTDAAGKEHFVFVNGGFAEALPDKVTVLAESAERRRDIDVDRAEDAKRRAEKWLAESKKKAEVDKARARAALDRAVQRIVIAGLR